MTEKQCVLGARELEKRDCCYLDCFFNCTAPSHQYKVCKGCSEFSDKELSRKWSN